MMDRWQITVSEEEESDVPGDPIPYNIVNNYFSIGVVSPINSDSLVGSMMPDWNDFLFIPGCSHLFQVPQ